MKKYVSVKLDEKGNIVGVLFEGNKRPTPVAVVKRMIAEGKVEGLELVKKKNGHSYVRTIANETAEDNLGPLAEAVEADEAEMRETWEAIKEAEAAAEAGEAADPTLVGKLKALLAKLNPFG